MGCFMSLQEGSNTFQKEIFLSVAYLFQDSVYFALPADSHNLLIKEWYMLVPRQSLTAFLKISAPTVKLLPRNLCQSLNVFQVSLPIFILAGYPLLLGAEKTQDVKACSTYIYPSCGSWELGNGLYSSDLRTVLEHKLQCK